MSKHFEEEDRRTFCVRPIIPFFLLFRSLFISLFSTFLSFNLRSFCISIFLPLSLCLLWTIMSLFLSWSQSISFNLTPFASISHFTLLAFPLLPPFSSFSFLSLIFVRVWPNPIRQHKM